MHQKFRSGRPRKTNHYDDNLIFRISRKDPKASCKKIAQQINKNLAEPITNRTVANRLIERNLHSYIAARKPLLKPSDRIKRIKFCRQLPKLTDEQLLKIEAIQI